jgi:hypothetical protein
MTAVSHPAYRFYNTFSDSHFYTVDAAERDSVMYLLIPGVGRGSPTGIDEALDVTTWFLIQARDGPAP